MQNLKPQWLESLEKIWGLVEYTIEKKGPGLLNKSIAQFSKQNSSDSKTSLKGKTDPKFKPWIALVKKNLALSKKPLIQNLAFQTSTVTAWGLAHFISQKDWIFQSRVDPTDKIVLHRFMLFIAEVSINWWLRVVEAVLEEKYLSETERKGLSLLKNSLEGWSQGIKVGALSRKKLLVLFGMKNSPLVFPMSAQTKKFLYKMLSTLNQD